jgi:hypothetical protein
MGVLIYSGHFAAFPEEYVKRGWGFSARREKWSG